MKRYLAITFFATACVAGQAFADDITVAEPFTSTRDRAEVTAELAAARGTANPWSIAHNPLARFQSSRTTAEVCAEYIASRDQVADMTGEDSGSFALSQPQADTRVAGQPVNPQ